jgi:hypothetical protein
VRLKRLKYRFLREAPNKPQNAMLSARKTQPLPNLKETIFESIFRNCIKFKPAATPGICQASFRKSVQARLSSKLSGVKENAMLSGLKTQPLKLPNI